MNLADFARLYEAKTDEQLAALATERTQLIPEAQAALASELSRRNIRPPVAACTDLLRGEFRSKRLKAPVAARQTVKFIAEVLNTYKRKRWAYIKLVFPAVLISYIAVTLARYESRLIVRQLYPKLESGMLHLAVLKVSIISGTAWLISWITFSLAFAAICLAVEQEHAGFDISVMDSLAEIRKRLGAFLRLSLLLLLIFVGLCLLVFFITKGVIALLGEPFSSQAWTAVRLISFLLSALALLIFFRFGLAIPAFILDDAGITQSIFRSDELTSQKWSILGFLLLKSVVGGYVAGMIPFWLARLFPADVRLPSGFQWLLVGVSVAAVTVVEPILFIGFTILYLKTTDVRPVAEPKPVV